jgi:hypothetical protein
MINKEFRVLRTAHCNIVDNRKQIITFFILFQYNSSSMEMFNLRPVFYVIRIAYATSNSKGSPWLMADLEPTIKVKTTSQSPGLCCLCTTVPYPFIHLPPTL